jgi:hypothetical protein
MAKLDRRQRSRPKQYPAYAQYFAEEQHKIIIGRITMAPEIQMSAYSTRHEKSSASSMKNPELFPLTWNHLSSLVGRIFDGEPDPLRRTMRSSKSGASELENNFPISAPDNALLEEDDRARPKSGMRFWAGCISGR